MLSNVLILQEDAAKLLADTLLRQAESEVKEEILTADPLARALSAIEKELHTDNSTDRGPGIEGPKVP